MTEVSLADIAMADAAIACWEAKNTITFSGGQSPRSLSPTPTATRPQVRIRRGCRSSATPAHPEYPSSHSTVSGASSVVLATFLGERKHFTVDNDLLIGVTRSFRSFSESLDEVRNARIFAGIHFRSACDDGQATIKVANWVLDHALLPVQ
jgi:hypothetical protein